VRAVNFSIASMWVDDAELPLMSADLVVVRRAETEQIDWECVAITVPMAPLPQSPCRLVMDDLLTGRQLHGEALVVRSDDQRHVFRGGSALGGLNESDGLENP
jgi:hypothetical protein